MGLAREQMNAAAAAAAAARESQGHQLTLATTIETEIEEGVGTT